MKAAYKISGAFTDGAITYNYANARAGAVAYHSQSFDSAQDDSGREVAVNFGCHSERSRNLTGYENIPEFCNNASFDEITKKDFSLASSKCIELVNCDENIDFDETMKALQKELGELFMAEAKSREKLLKVFWELGYEIPSSNI